MIKAKIEELYEQVNCLAENGHIGAKDFREKYTQEEHYVAELTLNAFIGLGLEKLGYIYGTNSEEYAILENIDEEYNLLLSDIQRGAYQGQEDSYRVSVRATRNGALKGEFLLVPNKPKSTWDFNCLSQFLTYSSKNIKSSYPNGIEILSPFIRII